MNGGQRVRVRGLDARQHQPAAHGRTSGLRGGQLYEAGGLLGTEHSSKLQLTMTYVWVDRAAILNLE